jgi:hypothetical protein
MKSLFATDSTLHINKIEKGRKESNRGELGEVKTKEDS